MRATKIIIGEIMSCRIRITDSEFELQERLDNESERDKQFRTQQTKLRAANKAKEYKQAHLDMMLPLIDRIDGLFLELFTKSNGTLVIPKSEVRMLVNEFMSSSKPHQLLINCFTKHGAEIWNN